MNKRILKKQHMRKLCNRFDDISFVKQGGALLLFTERRLDFETLKRTYDIFKKHDVSAVIIDSSCFSTVFLDGKAKLIEALEKIIEELKTEIADNEK